jgi:hypothetical protein
MARKHTILTALLLSTTPAAASPERTPPADSQVAKPLRDLRAELMNAGRDKAQADIGRFRALCDKDGYPLVGNIANKSKMYQPSQFCSDVRASGGAARDAKKAEKRS